MDGQSTHCWDIHDIDEQFDTSQPIRRGKAPTVSNLKKITPYVMVVGGAAVLTIGAISSSGAQADDSQRFELEETIVSDLSAVPGFGLDAQSMVRDDSIALWEAYQRELIVQDCMAASQLDYTVDVAFPAASVLMVAATYDLPDEHRHDLTLAGNAESENATKFASMDSTTANRYTSALYGESLADFESVNQTGNLPPGRSKFAEGGCVGKGQSELPGLYQLRRELAGDFQNARRGCGNASPKAANACERGNSTSDAARRGAEERFVERHDAAFRSQANRYVGIQKRIENDKDYLEFLASVTHGLTLDVDAMELQDADE